jgi:hypothetical protein
MSRRVAEKHRLLSSAPLREPIRPDPNTSFCTKAGPKRAKESSKVAELCTNYQPFRVRFTGESANDSDQNNRLLQPEKKFVAKLTSIFSTQLNPPHQLRKIASNHFATGRLAKLANPNTPVAGLSEAGAGDTSYRSRVAPRAA